MSKEFPNTLSPAEVQRLVELDRRHVWHPFTQHALWNRVDPLIIVGGQDEYVFDSAGRRYIDGHSSLWCNIHGHRRPEIDDAIRRQLDRIAHSTQLGLASPPAIELAKRLVDIAPAGLNKVFYSDDGSTSVEVACKLAFAYWQHRGQQRERFIALGNAYHGDTVGAVSLGGIDLFHRVYAPLLFKTKFAPSPYCYRCPLGKTPDSCGAAASCRTPEATRDRAEASCSSSLSLRAEGRTPGNTLADREQIPPCAEEIGRLLEQHRGQVAAVILEPLVQAAAGMITAPPGYLARVRQLCDRHDTLLIADEVATGFGRTGRMFACEHEGVSPDLLCLSKGLTGGYLPLAATLATDAIYDAFLGPIDSGRTFYHGHTFTGNPLGCAAALASLDIFEREGVLEQLPEKAELIEAYLRQLAGHPHVGDVRQAGMMAGVELVRDKTTHEPYAYGLQVGAQVCARALSHGVILRPLADTIVIMPPLCISTENLRHLMNTVRRCIDETTPQIVFGAADGLE